ncbi:MAG: aminopeptidase [Lachnospiraceae bacterium]|nr:aminopeptidase [Lachnospiraceae bacterium]
MTDTRYELVITRIKEIKDEKAVGEPFCTFFKRAASFLVMLDDIYKKAVNGEIRAMDLNALKDLNAALYEEILRDNYERSFSNPGFFTKIINKAGYDTLLAQYLSFLYTEIRGLIPYAFEADKDILTIYMELFVEIYCCFVFAYEQKRDDVPESSEIRQCIYWFERDNCEIVVSHRVREQLDPSCDFATDIIRSCDLTDLRYLYYFGEYITETEIRLAEFLNSLSDEDIFNMAKTYTQGYILGFKKTGKDVSKKRTVNIRYPIGFERMIRCAIDLFGEAGLKPVIYRAATLSINKRGQSRIGYYGAIPNRQYDYDHREDAAIYLDNDYVNRKLGVLRAAYEDNRELAGTHAGPAVVEDFGEEPFLPEEKKEACAFSDKQRKLMVKYEERSGRLTNEFIPGKERSFTIIAFPKPDIGKDFEEIFRETVKLNTLDYIRYESMQQILIDVLDKASFIRVAGKNGNETEMIVALNELKDPEHETNFENCVADVNIPVGEVFTTPKLKGTAGILHVPQVYLNGLKYVDLKLEISGGVIEKYSCANFIDEALNKKYIEDNLLYHHKTLPVGEFAIGTNTTAYRMARNYGIEKLLPILIGEKTGPHFAVGDTCYSYEEDIITYNPDGKAIVARSNDYSELRKTDPSKAYFHCHTDITIPYDELKGIYAITMDGRQTAIIEDGLFVLEGLSELNVPLVE